MMIINDQVGAKKNNNKKKYNLIWNSTIDINFVHKHANLGLGSCLHQVLIWEQHMLMFPLDRFVSHRFASNVKTIYIQLNGENKKEKKTFHY